MEITKTKLIISFFAIISVLQSTASVADTYEAAVICAKEKNYMCAYEKLFAFIEGEPSSRPLVSGDSSNLTELGDKLSEYLVLAESALSSKKTLEYSNKSIALIGSQTDDVRAQRFHVPYLILKAEACQATSDTVCFQNNAVELCEVIAEQGFSWPREQAANEPVSGRDRANVIRQSCPYKYQDDPKAIALFSKINEYIASIEGGGDIDNYQALFVPPKTLARMKAKNRWPQVKAGIEKRNPSLLRVLRYIKDKRPMFESHPVGYMATFDLKNIKGELVQKTISFVLKDNVWYVR